MQKGWKYLWRSVLSSRVGGTSILNYVYNENSIFRKRYINQTSSYQRKGSGGFCFFWYFKIKALIDILKLFKICYRCLSSFMDICVLVSQWQVILSLCFLTLSFFLGEMGKHLWMCSLTLWFGAVLKGISKLLSLITCWLRVEVIYTHVN